MNAPHPIFFILWGNLVCEMVPLFPWGTKSFGRPPGPTGVTGQNFAVPAKFDVKSLPCELNGLPNWLPHKKWKTEGAATNEPGLAVPLSY